MASLLSGALCRPLVSSMLQSRHSVLQACASHLACSGSVPCRCTTTAPAVPARRTTARLQAPARPAADLGWLNGAQQVLRVRALAEAARCAAVFAMSAVRTFVAQQARPNTRTPRTPRVRASDQHAILEFCVVELSRAWTLNGSAAFAQNAPCCPCRIGEADLRALRRAHVSVTASETVLQWFTRVNVRPLGQAVQRCVALPCDREAPPGHTAHCCLYHQ